MPLSKFLNNKQEKAPVISAGASSAYNPFAKLLEDNFMLNEKIQSNTLDFLSSETGVSNKPLQLDASKYASQNVYINDINTEAELNKERANNQSALEQTGRMLGQMVGSEVILGSLRGLSDIFDAGVELFSGDKDFTNPVSSYLEELQNEVRERLEIYRENPEAAWDITDYGWWTNNAVSIASTLSLAIPGGIYAKGLGLLGKAMKANKALRAGLSLVSKHPNLRTKQLESILGLGAHAGLMRTAEGYIEARDTYTQVKDEISAKLSEMSPEDKAELVKRNPSFAGLTDEEIASKAAGDSAEDVFKDDYWLMLLDAWQLKSLRNLGKGFKNIATTSTIREAQRRSIDNLVGRTAGHTKGFKNYLNNLDASSFKVFGAELSEGFEEGYQYIQQQEGIDKARKIIEPNYKARGYAEYITDPHMWEQAFWGWMGGVAFQSLGSATNAIAAKYISKNEDLLTRQRTAEIEGRIKTITDFASNVAMIRDENKNPFTNLAEAPEIEDVNEDGTEKAALLDYAFEKLVTDMTIEAAKKGNFDLLKEFFASEEFQEHMDKTGAVQTDEQKQYIADITKHMDEVYDIFEGELNNVIEADVVNQGVIDKIASDNTYIKLASRAAQRQIDEYNSQIQKSKNKYNDERIVQAIDEADKALKLELYNEIIDSINAELAKLDDDLNAKRINRAEHTRRKRNLNKEKQSLFRDLNFIVKDGLITDAEFNDYYNTNRNPSVIYNVESIDAAAYEAIYNKALQEYNKNRFYEPYIARTKTEIQGKARQVEDVFNEEVRNRLFKTIEQLDDIYENNDIDEVLSYIYGNENANLTDEVKNAVDKAIGDIKVYDESDEIFADRIVHLAEKKAKEKSGRATATVNGNPVNTPPTNPIPPVPSSTPTTGGTTSATSSFPTGGPTPQSLGLSTEGEEQANQAQLEQERRIREQEERDDVGARIGNDVKNIGIAGLQDDTFKALTLDEKIEYVKEQLRHNGYQEKDITDNEKLIKSWMRIVQGNIDARRHSSITIDTITKEDIVGITSLGIDLNDDFFELAIKKFKNENQVLEVGGKVYFNMISFLKYLANSNEISNFETLKAVYKEFYNYINNNDTYSFAGSSRINDATLNKIIEGLSLSSIETDNRAAVLKESERGAYYYLALNSIKPNDTLQVQIEKAPVTGKENGISFWKVVYITPDNPVYVKVAFNKFAKKGIYKGTKKYNNSYLTTSNSLEYLIWQDTNGEYHSDLDNVINEILADEDKLSSEAIEFLEFILDNNKLDNSTYNQLINNNLFKELFKFSKNENLNIYTAKAVLNSIRNIYNYDNGDHFDKRQSFKIWIKKQYSNYKFTDDLRNISKVSVKSISEGMIVTGPKTDIDKAVVNFNLTDHHLGFVNGEEQIIDTLNGETKQAPGFRHRGLVVILPNGTKAPQYAKIFSQQIDYTKGFGKAIRDEVRDAIVKHITAEDNFDTTVNKLMSIFNYSGFVSDILCKEFDGRIIIANAESDVPIITIYKKQADKVTDSTGISVNLGTRVDQSVGAIEITPETEELINKGLDKLLANSTYALSYDFINSDPTTNKYVTKNPDKSLTINIGGQVFNYQNYLDFIVKNKVGKIEVGKQDLGYGVQTNFMPNENNQMGNANIRVEIISESAPRRGRVEAIEALEAEGNKKNKAISTIIKTVAPSFIDYKVLKEDNFLGAKVDIEMKDAVDPNTGNVAKAAYNKKTKKITLYKGFFDIAKTDDGEYHAMRILVHENIHKAINEIDNPFEREDFVDGLREIRDIFLEALETGTSRNDNLVQYLKSIGENPEEKIAIFKSLFDNAHDELYNLEEFIAESLTSKLLQNVLNNIESSRTVNVQTENLSLWQRIIQAIRKLFGFGDIKDNTLLAQEFALFSDNFKLDKNYDDVNQGEEEQEDESASEDSEGDYFESEDGTGFDTTDEEYEDEDGYSAIEIDNVPNVVAAARQMSISERAKFEASLSTGRIQMYCR